MNDDTFIAPKHTPGPFYVGAQNDGLFIVTRQPVMTDHPDHGKENTVIAKLVDGTADDARLFAAAPDLLDALSHLMGVLPAICEYAGLSEDFKLNARDKVSGETREMPFSELLDKALAAFMSAVGEPEPASSLTPSP